MVIPKNAGSQNQQMPPFTILSSSSVVVPLVYLAMTLITAVYFSQLWLFIISALGVVWVDTQISWRTHQMRKSIAEKHLTDILESIKRENVALPEENETMKTENSVSQPVPKGQALAIDSIHGDPDCKSHSLESISVVKGDGSVIPNNPFPLSFTKEKEQPWDQDEDIQSNDFTAPAGAGGTIHKDEKSLVGGGETDDNDDDDLGPSWNITTLECELEAVKRELEHAISTRNKNDWIVMQQHQDGQENEASVIPALPEPSTPNDDEDLNIISMEELESTTVCSSTVASIQQQSPILFGNTAESQPSLGFPNSCGSSPLPAATKDTPHFPIIDDVLSAYEASLHSDSSSSSSTTATISSSKDSDMHTNTDDDDWEDNDNKNNSTNTSGINSPATSISESVKLNDDVHELDLNMRPPSPSPLSVSLPESLPRSLPIVTLPLPSSIRIQEANTENQSLAKSLTRPVLARASSSRSSSRAKKRPSRKNNGWKRIPKKRRLSPSSKKKFLSRAFW